MEVSFPAEAHPPIPLNETWKQKGSWARPGKRCVYTRSEKWLFDFWYDDTDGFCFFGLQALRDGIRMVTQFVGQQNNPFFCFGTDIRMIP